MDSFEFNSVKSEKADAIRSYNIQKMLKKLELLTAFALLAWSCYNYIPAAAAAKLSADFLLQNAAVLGHPLYVFISINILVIVIFVLSSSSSPSSQKPTKQDLYDDYVTITNAPRRSSTSADDYKPAPEVKVPVSEKQIVSVDNAVSSLAAKAITTTTTTTTTTVVKDCEPVCLVQESEPVCPVQESEPVWVFQESEPIGTVTGVKEYYRRTRSERLDRGKGNNRELMRRSETLNKRTTEVKMDDLSSEEFRLTIETFIAAKRKTLIKENSLDLNLASQKIFTKDHQV